MSIHPSAPADFPALASWSFNGDLDERLCETPGDLGELALELVAASIETGGFSRFLQSAEDSSTDSEQKLSRLLALQSENQAKMDALLDAQGTENRNGAELDRLYARGDDIALVIISTSWTVDYERGQRAIGEALSAVLSAVHNQDDLAAVAARPLPEIVSCALNTVRSTEMPTTVGELAVYLLSGGEPEELTGISLTVSPAVEALPLSA